MRRIAGWAAALVLLTSCAAPTTEGAGPPRDSDAPPLSWTAPPETGLPTTSGSAGSATSGSATAEKPRCPASGVRFSVAGQDAAMGERLVDVRLTNCGSRDYVVSGHPTIDALDVEGVIVGRSQPGVLSPDIEDPKPRSLTIAPGQSVTTLLTWRSTLTVEGGGYQAEQITVTAEPGGDAGTVALGIDMGDTHQLFATAWMPSS